MASSLFSWKLEGNWNSFYIYIYVKIQQFVGKLKMVHAPSKVLIIPVKSQRNKPLVKTRDKATH